MSQLRIEKILTFLAAWFAVQLNYQLCLVRAYSSDSWHYLFYPEGLPFQHSATARPFAAGLQLMVNRCGLNIVQLHLWDGLLGIILLAFSILVLQHALVARSAGDLKAKAMAFLIAFAFVCNPLVSEWFGNDFIVPPACLAQLLSVSAGIVLAKRDLRLKHGAAVFCMAVIADGLFQSPISLLAPVAIVLLALRFAPLQTIVRRTIIGLAAWVTGGLFCYTYVRLIHPQFSKQIDSRTASFHPLVSLKAVLGNQKEIWVHSFGMIPQYVFLWVLIAALFLLILSRVPNRIKLLTCGAAVLLAVLSIGVHVITAIVWIVPRSLTSICALIGLLTAPALISVRRRSYWVTFALLASWLVISAFCSTRILADHIANFQLDLLEARLIYQEIADYEQKSGVKVQNVEFQMDAAPVWCYPEIICVGDFNVRSWTKAFARIPMLDTVSRRDFHEIRFKRGFAELFGKANWDEFTAGQVKCIGDTAYIAIY